MDDVKKLELSFRDFTIGTLWWAREELIRQNYPSWNYNKNRKQHPLLSLLKTPPENDLCFIPMLPGTTFAGKDDYIARNGLILVTCLEKDDPGHRTVFGEVCNADGGFLVQELLYYNDKAAKNKSVGEFRDVRKVWSNVDKPKCNPQEMAEVDHYYQLHFTNESLATGEPQP